MGMETGRSKTKQADHSKPFERNPPVLKRLNCVTTLVQNVYNSQRDRDEGERAYVGLLGSISNPTDAAILFQGSKPFRN